MRIAIRTATAAVLALGALVATMPAEAAETPTSTAVSPFTRCTYPLPGPCIRPFPHPTPVAVVLPLDTQATASSGTWE